MLRSLPLVLALFCVAAAYTCSFTPTPRVTLDRTQYSGRWYLLEAGPLGNSSGPIDCIYVEYSVSDNPLVLDLNWHGQSNGTVVPDSGIVTFSRPDTYPAIHQVYMDETVFQSAVVATDYSTWAIEYTCHPGLSYERFMLRSRTSTLTADTRATLRNFIAGFGVDINEFGIVNHSNCLI